MTMCFSQDKHGHQLARMIDAWMRVASTALSKQLDAELTRPAGKAGTHFTMLVPRERAGAQPSARPT